MMTQNILFCKKRFLIFCISTLDDFNFSRKKKHPEVAYRSHEFFDTSLASTGVHSGGGNRMSESVDGSDKVCIKTFLIRIMNEYSVILTVSLN